MTPSLCPVLKVKSKSSCRRADCRGQSWNLDEKLECLTIYSITLVEGETCKKETSYEVTETWPENWFCTWKATHWVGFVTDSYLTQEFLFSQDWTEAVTK